MSDNSADSLRRELEAAKAEVVHLCPHEGKSVMPCCGLTPCDVPRWHRMTLDPKLVKGDQ